MTEHINRECRGFTFHPVVVEPVDRIIAIGDIHGDFDYLIHVLKIARVIDNDYKWIGGNTYVVQLGDQIDNCRPYYNNCNTKGATPNDKAEDIKIINYMDELHNEAIKYNGAVISLIGNHEILNINGVMDYVSYENLQKSNGITGRMKDFSSSGTYGRKIICTHPSSIIIGTNLFVHAGILPRVIELIPEFKKLLKQLMNDDIDNLTAEESVNYIINKTLYGGLNKRYLYDMYPENSKIWDAMLSDKHNAKKVLKTLSEDTNKLTGLLKKTDDIKKQIKENLNSINIDNMHPIELINFVMQKLLLTGKNEMQTDAVDALNSLFWNRIFGSVPNETHKNAEHETCNKQLQPVLNVLNVNNMIIGHTPQFMASQSGINTACDGKLTRVDIGGASIFNLFDSTYEKTGNRMKQRVPQILEILNDTHTRILYDEKYNNMSGGGKSYNLFKNCYFV